MRVSGMTPKECRHNAETCRKLASETDEIYVKEALIELAAEFRILAGRLEGGSSAWRSRETAMAAFAKSWRRS